MKYIKADEIPSLFNEEYERTRKLIEQGETHLDNLAEGFLEAKQVISRIPATDVIEVKHGEWQEVKRWECTTHSVTDMKCSICHHYASLVLPHQTTCTYDFCPFCGADMRGKAK